MPLEPCLVSARAHHRAARSAAGPGGGLRARFVTERPSRIAVINAGYADGMFAPAHQRGSALVRGRRVPLVGTISMDLTTSTLPTFPA